jgi:hypothetical protein
MLDIGRDRQRQININLAKPARPIALDIEYPTIYPRLPKKLLQSDPILKATTLTRVHNLIAHITPLCLTISSSVSASVNRSRICIIVRYTSFAWPAVRAASRACSKIAVLVRNTRIFTFK